MSVMNSTIAIINDNDQILVIETGRRYNIEYRTEKVILKIHRQTEIVAWQEKEKERERGDE